jgi:diguanylate cyclase (GGDEF)-like protein
MSGNSMRPDFWATIDVGLLDQLFVDSAEAVYLWDASSDSFAWSPNAHDILSVSDADLPCSNAAYLARMGADDKPARALAFCGRHDSARAFHCEYKFRRSDGGYEWLEERATFERDTAGEAVRVLGRIRVVSNRREREQTLESMAFYDDLTGLLSRRRLLASLDAAIDYCRENDGRSAYLVVNIDRLGGLNNYYGFDVADAVIVEVAKRLRDCALVGDVLGRVGGNQFGVVLFDAGTERMKNFAEQVLRSIRAEEVVTPKGPIMASVSIGGVTMPNHADGVDVAVGRAEEALSEAKAKGRDRFFAYRHSKTRDAARLRALAAGDTVLTALREGRLTYAVQPIVDGHTGEPRFYECLMRMMDPDGQPVPAGLFLPAAEQLGIIRKLDRHTIELALAELEATRDVHLAVNVSGMTATDPAMLSLILSMIDAHSHVAERLTFEITETVAMLDFDETVRFVSRLRDLGCRVAIDDFGAGYTSFRHLKSLVVDMVKIDGQYVQGLASNAENQLFVDTLLELARGIGVSVVAECVETEAEATALRQRGVDYLQGYLFGAPTLARPWDQATPAAVLG